MTQQEKILFLESQLIECMEAFKQHIRAVEKARRVCNNSDLWAYFGLDDEIDAAEERLWNLKDIT